MKAELVARATNAALWNFRPSSFWRRRARGPAGYETVVKIIAPESDYWPLPWYLRRFKHLGWYEKLPGDPFAPIIVVSSKLDARLDEKSAR